VTQTFRTLAPEGEQMPMQFVLVPATRSSRPRLPREGSGPLSAHNRCERLSVQRVSRFVE
jgi:hypothetical protein